MQNITAHCTKCLLIQLQQHVKDASENQQTSKIRLELIAFANYLFGSKMPTF